MTTLQDQRIYSAAFHCMQQFRETLDSLGLDPATEAALEWRFHRLLLDLTATAARVPVDQVEPAHIDAWLAPVRGTTEERFRRDVLRILASFMDRPAFSVPEGRSVPFLKSWRQRLPGEAKRKTLRERSRFEAATQEEISASAALCAPLIQAHRALFGPPEPENSFFERLDEAVAEGPVNSILQIEGGAEDLVPELKRALPDAAVRLCSVLGLGEAERTKAVSLGAEIASCRASRLELPDSSVDLAISLEVLSYLRNPAALIDEMARVLRPGGRLVLQVSGSESSQPSLPRSAILRPPFEARELRALFGRRFSGIRLEQSPSGLFILSGRR